MDIKAAIKEPWVKYTLIGVAGLGLLYIVSRNAGGGAVQSSGVDPALAQLSAQQAQLAQQAASQASQNNFNLTLDAQQSAEKYKEASLAAQTSTTQQANAITGQLSLAQLASITATHQADTAAAAQVQLGQIAANQAAQQAAATVTLGQIQANATTHIAEIASNTTIATNQQANLTQQHIADMQAQTAQASITATQNLGLAQAGVAIVQSNNNANVAIHTSDNSAAVAMAQAAANADIAKTVSNNNASTANHSSNNNLIGAALNLVTHLF